MRLTLALAFIFATQLTVSNAHACDCIVPNSPKRELETSTAVFSGKCISVEIKEQQKIVTFEVDRVWKGDVGRKVVVTTGMGGGDCGYRFTTKGDGTYLVYCYGKPQTLGTNICTRTRSLAEGAQDIKELGEGNKPKDQKKKE